MQGFVPFCCWYVLRICRGSATVSRCRSSSGSIGEEGIRRSCSYEVFPLSTCSRGGRKDLKADTLADQQEGNQKHRQHLQIDQSPRTSTIHPSQWIATKKHSNMARKQINYSPWQLSGIIHQPRPKPCQIEQYSLSFQTCYNVYHSPDIQRSSPPASWILPTKHAIIHQAPQYASTNRHQLWS